MKTETKVQRAKKIIKSFYKVAKHGIFDTRNFAGDPMNTLYNDGEITIDICFYYEYFEVFGLTESEFAEVEQYYSELKNDRA